MCKRDDLFERKNNLISKSRKEKRSLKEEKLRNKNINENINELNEFLENLAVQSIRLEEIKRKTKITEERLNVSLSKFSHLLI